MSNTHGARLERWLGAEQVALISERMRGWHGSPVPIANVPGNVYASGDGDFVGALRGGHYAGLADYAADKVRTRARRFLLRQRATANFGFSSLGDLISEATSGGKRQDWYFYKGPSTAAISNQTLWQIGDIPQVGTTPSARPGGSTTTRTTTGSVQQANAAAGDSLHLVGASLNVNVAQTLFLYDRLFHAASILHTTTGNQSITGVPTRYTGTDANGVFVTLEVTSTIGATAHNVTLTYTDQDGNAAEAGTAQGVITGAVANRIPFSTRWFYRLNDGDTGCRTITNIAFSAVSSGTSRLVQGKALVIMPHANNPNGGNCFILFDGINAVPGLPRILDDACLAFFVFQGVATATTYHGQLVMVSG